MNTNDQPATPGADEESATITLHIKCDPNLTNDDSDELVVHVMPEGRVMLEIYQGPGLGTNYVMTVLETIPAMQLKTFIGEMSYEHQKALVHISELESDLRFSADVNEKLDRVITHLEDGLKRIKTRSSFSECVNVADRVLRETREQLAAARTQCELRSAGHDDLRTKLNQANRQLNQLRAALAERDRELTIHEHRAEAKHNEGHWGMPQGDCQCVICKPIYTELSSLRSQLQAATARAEEAEKDRDKWTDEANARFISWEKSELDLQAIQKRADLLNTHNEHWVGVIRDQAAQLLALQAHVEAQSRALRNLIFTATKCWDDVKPIKDGPGLTVTHPMIEEAKAVMESQPDLPLIEEVREVLENVRGFEVIGERCRKRIDSILARLNPTKL